MIELHQLSKVYQSGTKALSDINLSIAKGEIFGVIGESGAGKSSLIRCVNLLEIPTTGQVVVNGQNLCALSPPELREARKKIGMIFQSFNLLSSRTVLDNVALPFEISGMSAKKYTPKVMQLLEFTGLSNKKNVYPSHLSGGQKQRVAIARALATNPAVLLSDEATSALDPNTTHSILQLLKSINEEFGVTILLITHEMDVVKEICHRLAILEHGRIIEEASVFDFFCNPKTQTARNFLRSRLQHNLPDSIQRRLQPDTSPGNNILLSFSFIGGQTNEPLLANLIKDFHIDINILQANIETIREEIVGTMVVEIAGSETRLEEAINYMRQKGISVEVIGYVRPID